MRTGLERLLSECPAELKGKRIGLFTGLSAAGPDMRPSLDLRNAFPDITLDRLFAHEHGLYGDIPAGASVEETVDRRTGKPVLRIYGPGHTAQADLVAGLDAVLVDMGGGGARDSTSPGSTLHLLGACHGAGAPMYILDRPNSLGGRYEGQRAVAREYRSLVGATPVPMRHGLSMGEIILLAARESGWQDAVHVVAVEGWRRSQLWPAFGQPFSPGSSNSNSYEMGRVYPGTCLWEGTNMSEGRGTALPFQQVGAPWLDAWQLCDRLRPLLEPGVYCRPRWFRPTASKHEGSVREGVMLQLDPERDVDVVPPALHLLALMLEHPESRILEARDEPPGRHCFMDLLAGSDRLRRDLGARRPVPDILDEWRRELADWEDTRSAVSLYPE